MKSILGTNILLLFLISCFILSGCALNDEAMPASPSVAVISFYNSSPNAGKLDLYIDNTKVNTNLENSTFSGYNSFYSGFRNFKFTSHLDDKPIIDTLFSIEPDKIYSIFLYNEVKNLKSIIVEDIWYNPTSEKALIRLINLAPDTPAIDVYLNEQNTSFVEKLNYQSVCAYKEIESGTLTFSLKESGKDSLIASLPQINIQPKTIYTIVIGDSYNAPLEVEKTVKMNLITNHTIL